MLERDDALVLTAHDVFQKLDEYSENKLAMENTDLIVDKVYNMLDSVYSPMLDNVNKRKQKCDI